MGTAATGLARWPTIERVYLTCFGAESLRVHEEALAQARAQHS